MTSLRGPFKLFAARSGQNYANKVASSLNEILAKREKEIEGKEEFKDYRLYEKQFIKEAKYNPIHVGKAKSKIFLEGEPEIEILEKENVRDADVFLVQNHVSMDNDISFSENFMETLHFIDALKRAKAGKVALISLYYPSGRSDRQYGKNSVGAKLNADMLQDVGLDSLITMDLHADQIPGFFDRNKVRVEHMYFSPIGLNRLEHEYMSHNLKISAPDSGGVKRAKRYAEKMNLPFMLAYKEKDYSQISKIENIVLLGDPRGHFMVTPDDIGGSMGTLKKQFLKLADAGATDLLGIISHLIAAGEGVDFMDELYEDPDIPFKGIICSDSIPQPDYVLNKPWYLQEDTSKIIARAIYEIHTSGSVSQLYEPETIKKLNLWTP